MPIPVTPKEVEAFVLKGLSHGWACGADPVIVPDMPGYKGTYYSEVTPDGRIFLMRDCWCVGQPRPDGAKPSAGTTMVWVNATGIALPAWVMQYSGYYPKEAIPIVKAALLTNYVERKFVGGRGPMIFASPEFPNLRYRNRTLPGQFLSFSGTEEVFLGYNPLPCGQHHCRGMWLLG